MPAPQLRAFATSRGISAPDGLTAIDEGRYAGWIGKNTEEAAKAGITRTPTLLLSGQPSEPRPRRS